MGKRLKWNSARWGKEEGVMNRLLNEPLGGKREVESEEEKKRERGCAMVCE